MKIDITKKPNFDLSNVKNKDILLVDKGEDEYRAYMVIQVDSRFRLFKLGNCEILEFEAFTIERLLDHYSITSKNLVKVVSHHKAKLELGGDE